MRENILKCQHLDFLMAGFIRTQKHHSQNSNKAVKMPGYTQKSSLGHSSSREVISVHGPNLYPAVRKMFPLSQMSTNTICLWNMDLLFPIGFGVDPMSSYKSSHFLNKNSKKIN